MWLSQNIEYQSWSLNRNRACIFVGWAVNVSSTIHQFILWSRYLNIWNYKQETLLGISKFYWFQFLPFKTFPVKTLLVKFMPENIVLSISRNGTTELQIANTFKLQRTNNVINYNRLFISSLSCGGEVNSCLLRISRHLSSWRTTQVR